jgi:adenine-specific DNA-methyltransferase
MNNKTELQSILQSKYNRSNWQKLFQDIFPQISLYATPKEIIIPEKALEGRIEKLFQLGTVRLQDGRDIKIFELKLTEKVKLYKNKVEMRNLISKFIDIGTDNGVLAIFDSADEDYRLTFSAKDVYLSETEGMVNKETDSKRYTYLLGPNESCRTAAERLFDLYENKNELTLEQLTKAFSVEKLNKQFFADYTGIYEKFTDYLGASYDKKKKETDTVISGEFSKYFKDKVEAREFVKKLMGRVVFIHFVQKKGWMGCSPATKKWEKGNKEFLWNFWESCTDKGHFYSKYLTELFFNGFNVKRENDIFALTGNRIPFLNGGLFSNDRPKTNVIDFPIEIFGEFLEKLNFYNWHYKVPCENK